MALYRKYRPATFAEVVGQEQVTTPLSAALDSGRINHAYLFSGPRGCGKTSSARIMARSLNCAEGPTSQPCGTCPSCVSLAPGGPGNLDVTELDAASHNGVDDMRELRDRAYYAPAESRYRIFIIDEAHMISQSGANALLKVVEEPPEHVIFIFATTEPEKIIGTIRSRTHHYPFRLLTPPAMKGLLQRTVESENVHVDDAVYPMVIQAGGGSPRDTLSILDQLLAGAGPDGLTYELARPLLGVTDLSLLDDTIAALSAGDKAGLFKLVDDVIEAGHEPRRFAVDLLDRLRDLMVLQAVPDACEAGLVDAPTDRASVLAEQAQAFSGPHLAFLAAKVNEQISQLRGATSPRLLLEILCANLVSAAAPVQEAAPTFDAPRQSSQAGGTASVSSGQQSPSRASQPGQSGADAAAAAAAAIANRRRNAQQGKAAQPAQQQPQQAPQQAEPAQQPEPEVFKQPQPEITPQPAPQPASQPEPEAAKRPEPQQPKPQQPAQPSPEELAERIRTEWAAIRVNVGKKRKPAEIMLTEARVLGIKDDTLVLGHTTGALAERLNADDNNAAIVEAVQDRVDVKLAVKCIIGTDPEKAGFAAPAGPKPTWNPQQEEQGQDDADDQESESPASESSDAHSEPAQAEAETPQAPTESDGTAGESTTEESTTEESASEEPDVYSGPPAEENPQSQHEAQKEANPEVEESAPEPQVAESKPASGGWGAPRPIGGQDSVPARPVSTPEPRREPTPQAPQRQEPQRSSRPSWQDKIAQVTQDTAKREEEFNKNAFSNGVPLPPEPEDDYPAPPEEENYSAPPQYSQQPQGRPQPQPQGQPQSAEPAPASAPEPYSRDDEERDMIEAAQEAGEHDHRSSTEVAMELLEKELGARRA